MKIALLGYGKMGKVIETVALSRGHEIVATIDKKEDWLQKDDAIKQAQVAIEFSVPEAALQNIAACFERNLPVVVGTTGWYDHLEEIKAKCESDNKSLFYASNFSIGVNIFFEINKKLAELMNPYEDYDVYMEETHHIHKLDAPSGTAISLANQILENINRKKNWTI
ncbi:MAG: 4-hydroxy-tetrahydrodipicolinate reductase, partial [Bacteroidales bacterium]|nr:4-hydroxy-tetrahydrodipicolinate reductase [Bacteroidales bacterium]